MRTFKTLEDCLDLSCAICEKLDYSQVIFFISKENFNEDLINRTTAYIKKHIVQAKYKYTNIRIEFSFYNGSSIYFLVAAPNMRGRRANMCIYEDSIDDKFKSTVMRPMCTDDLIKKFSLKED